MRLNLAQRTSALLDLVEKYREARSAEILDPAREQARARLRTARTEARRRVRTAVGEARQRLATELGAAQARLATERRLAEQQHAAQVLQEAWHALYKALRERWRDETTRRLWCEAHLARALEALSREHWRIECAGDLSPNEREEFSQRLDKAGVAEVTWQLRDDIAGGLRFRAGNNRIDATIDGLLADRAALEGRLLDALLSNGVILPAPGEGEPIASPAKEDGRDAS